MWWTTNKTWFESRRRHVIFSFPEHPDQLWNPRSLLFSGYRSLFLQRKTCSLTPTQCRGQEWAQPHFHCTFMACTGTSLPSTSFWGKIRIRINPVEVRTLTEREITLRVKIYVQICVKITKPSLGIQRNDQMRSVRRWWWWWWWW